MANTPIRFKMGSAWLTHHMTSHVVVDGSNIATEGHKTPRLGQLVEAVEQFLTDRPHDRVTVICDASFPNRIEESERKQYESFLEDGWLMTPPAGAIGRGDAFILQVAAKANAAVLSNDSFQEFHGEHSWLFDDGRLVGGKPVPGVGWIFVDRLPVRGPTSRKAVRDADRAASGSDSTTEVAPADVVKPKARRVRKSPAKASTPKKAAKKVGNKAATSATKDTAAKPVTASTAKRRARKLVAAKPQTPVTKTKSRESAAAAEIANNAEAFASFVAAHPLGSEVLAQVETFASHGAYALVGDVRCFVPVKSLGSPAPRRAKDVLSVGDERTFVVLAIHEDVHGVDLGLSKSSLPKRRTKKIAASSTKKAGARKRVANKTAKK